MTKPTPSPEANKFNNWVLILDKLINISLSAFVIFSVFSISLTQISLTIGVAAWLLKVHTTKTWRKLKGTSVGIAMLFFSLVFLLATITSANQEVSLDNIKKLFQFSIFFWVINSVRDQGQRNYLIELLILAGLSSSLYGLYQSMDPIFNDKYRIHGTLGVPSTFAGVLMLVGLATLGQIFYSKTKKYWLLGALGIIATCLVATMTRQAWVGFILGTTFLLIIKNKKIIWALPIVLTGLLFFSNDEIKNRLHSFTNLNDVAFQSRVSVWKSGWEAIKQSPIKGCGFNCINPADKTIYLQGMHSNIFQLLVDMGLLGLTAWLAIWVTFFFTLFNRWKDLPKDEKASDGQKGILIGTTAAIIGFLAGGLFETNFYDSEIAMLLFLLMGLSLSHNPVSTGKRYCPSKNDAHSKPEGLLLT